MGIIARNTTKVAVEIETTEGTYVAPTGATSFVQTLADGFELTPSKELLERNIFAGSLGKPVPRTGTRSVTGSIPCEARANSTAGSAPEVNALLMSAMGTRRQITTTVTTKASGNTDDTLQIEDADISKFAVGDIILVKESGEYHVSPITAVDSTGGAANITLLVALPSGNFSNSVVIEKSTIYSLAESGHKSLSITKYLGDAIRETAFGCKVNSMALSSFATGQLPQFDFGFEGLNFANSLTAPAYTPSYDTSLPPIVLSAGAYIDGSLITVNEVSFSLENTLGFATSISEANGKSSSRFTGRSVTGSLNPYKDDGSIANFEKFRDNTQFSLFGYAMNPTASAGEFGQIIAFYMPACLITEYTEADADGLAQEQIAFTASRGTAGTTNELYLAFI